MLQGSKVSEDPEKEQKLLRKKQIIFHSDYHVCVSSHRDVSHLC